jgi:hypothetical protein
MKYKIFILTILLLVVSCATEEEVFVPIEKITDTGKEFSMENFKQIGFKKSKEYNVEDLPGAKSAYYGFIKNALGNPEDYEVRFYDNHQDAVQLGVKYADNITGENACLKKDCSLWTENLNQRIHLEGGRNNTWNTTPDTKYMNYVIHNNLILMCPGYNEEDALVNCTHMINKINQ